MTKYTGSNMTLEYDPSNVDNPWQLNNIAQDFIDINAFSTPEPKFEMVTPEEEDEEETVQECPPGYIYDSTLKQCVPDTEYQSDVIGQPLDSTGGRDEPAVDPENPYGIWVPPVKNPDGTWTPGYMKKMPNTLAKFNSQDLYDFGVSKGYIDEATGELMGPQQVKEMGGIFGGMATTVIQKLNRRQYDEFLRFANKQGLVSQKGIGAAGTPVQVFGEDRGGYTIGPAGMASVLLQEQAKTPTAELRGGIYSPRDREALIKEKEAEAESLAKEQRLLEEARQASQEKRNMQETIKRAEEIEERKKTVGQTGGPAGGGFIPRPPTGQTGGPAGMGSPPPNTSPIGGTGQTYAQFKKR